MEDIFQIYTVLGVTVLILAMAAGIIKQKLWISEPLLATAVGVFVGPLCLGLFQPSEWGNQEGILEEIARVSLAISLMGVAFRLPDSWIRQRWRPLLLILLIGMPSMWVIASLCGWLILDLPLLSAFLLGALIAPTDRVVASSIVTGKLAEDNIKADTRHLISAESGANDGLAFLLIMLPALLLEAPPPTALREWFIDILLGTIICSLAGGALAGWGVGNIVAWLHKHKSTHKRSLLAVSIALALALLGIAKLLHGDGILAVFAAGVTLNIAIREDQGHEEARHERMQSTVKEFFEVPVFILFGMVIPFDQWLNWGWPLAVFALAILLLRRLPVLLAMYRWLSPIHHLKDALFVGWFGPIAVAAMVYVSWADVKEGYHELWIIGSFIIFVSIVVHGMTATPFTRWYAKQ